ncbi:sorbosone dehydrogenase family protein [Geminocystis sp. NIES-3709]|uniref:PQQ-dependent sugar dehydrogenase n=1 Tax=Geminocystis sp. NIES-3709 TaxID=1617448 RepID=UPI0005FCC6D1|nr:sorbosone dehydrogenase family protein [Geminocystis sp. NIES-3709]BAQ66372.1 L-sorbosone dehydrogenase [Geminocystis sp. NIES-3709]
MKLKYLSFLLIFSIVSCAINVNQKPSVSQSPEVSSISTQILNPKPIKITLDELPEPFISESASQPPQILPIPSSKIFNVPVGFQVNIYAEGLNNPRWLTLTPDGNVLVTETRDNRITLLQDSDNDGVADKRSIFADESNGLNIPFGMTFTSEYFFLGNHDGIRRYDYSQGQNKLQDEGISIASLPGGGYNQHWTRNVVVSPVENKLYVSIGSRSNNSIEEIPRASIQTMDFEGNNQKTFAFGLRNPVGLDFHPVTNKLYTTVNERDGLGDDLVPDYFTHVKENGFYGWPFSYLSSKLLDPNHIVNGKSINPELVSQTITPDILIESHSAPLGLQFYDGQTFPEKYRNGAFVAFRGSWNRSQGTGYKLVFIPFDETAKPKGYYEDFLTGFLTDVSIPSTWGRPVGLLIMPDGSMLFTEEANGIIYRIQYVG